MIALMVTQVQRLCDYQSKAVGSALLVGVIFLTACWIYFTSLWIFGVDLFAWTQGKPWRWLIIGLVFAVSCFLLLRAIPKERRPILKYDNISGLYIVFHGVRYNALIANILNVQTSVKNTANATARIEYIHDAGTDRFVTKEAVWLNVTGEDLAEQETAGYIPGGKLRSVLFLLIDEAKRAMMPTGVGNPPVRELGIGHWTAKLSITSETCNPLEGDIGFTVLEDREFRWDQPAFTLRRASKFRIH